MAVEPVVSGIGSTRSRRWLDLAGRLAPFLFLLAAGASLRFQDLGFRSLWLDEVTTAQAVRLPDLRAVLDYVGRDPSATPLPYIVTWLFRPFGSDEFAIRVPYAVAGTLAVVAMYALAARLYGRAAGLVAGTLLMILPYAIFYSQEARSYAFLMLLTSLMMLAACRAVDRGRVVDWVLLSVTGALDLYTGYLAIAVVLAAYAYVGLVIAGDGLVAWRATGFRPALAVSGRRVVLSGFSVVLMGVLMLPWIRHVRAFLSRTDQGFGRAATGHQATLDEAQALLLQLDLHGILLWLVVAGITSALIGVARGRWKQALLPLTWFGIPLLGFAIGTGAGIVTIWPRYFGAIYPAAILLAAIGIDGLGRAAVGVARLGRSTFSRDPVGPHPSPPRWRPASGPSVIRVVVMAGLLGVVAGDALPADAAAYTRAKGSDYRGAVDLMYRTDPGRPMVLVFGNNPDWTVGGLDYYNWIRGSRLTVIDALKFSAENMKVLEGATTAWGAAFNAPDLPDPAAGNLDGGLFADFWLVRPAAGNGPAIEQARSILRWAASFEPQITATTRLFDVLQGHGTLGTDVLPSPPASRPETGSPPLDTWILQPGSSLSADGRSFKLDPGGLSTNVYLTTLNLTPGLQYVVSFSCGTSQLIGSANVFVVADVPTGQAAFPDGAGYACHGTEIPEQAVFAFTMPDDATSARVWLRATGSGTATYEQVSLRSFE
ncbi:MAG: glycosyltransferase family 39 protein [Chloroflexota bacterium]